MSIKMYGNFIKLSKDTLINLNVISRIRVNGKYITLELGHSEFNSYYNGVNNNNKYHILQAKPLKFEYEFQSNKQADQAFDTIIKLIDRKC